MNKLKFKIGDMVMINSDWPVENRTKWKIEHVVSGVGRPEQNIYYGTVVYPEELKGRNTQGAEQNLVLYKAKDDFAEASKAMQKMTNAFARVSPFATFEEQTKIFSMYMAFDEVETELKTAMKNFPPFNSAHEGLAVLEEEVKELRDWVYTNQKRRDIEKMKQEAKQVAAMAIRFYIEVCNEKTGRK